MELLVLAVVAGLSYASYALWRQGRAPRERKALSSAVVPNDERTIHSLQVGDVVSYAGADFLVEGSLALEEDGRVTRFFHLMDGARALFLLARPNEPRPLLLSAANDWTDGAQPPTGPELLHHRGAPYRLEARERVMAKRVGAFPVGGEGRAQFLEYAGPGTSRLVTIQFGDRIDAFVGERVAEGAIELLPGKG